MGVAIVIAPLMLLFLLAPLLYLFIAFVVAKGVSKLPTKASRRTAFIATIAIISIYPVHLYLEYLEFSELCENTRPPITVNPILSIDSIAFVSEGGDFVHTVFLWHREMKLNLDKYEYAYIVNGKETMRNLCNWGTHDCKYGGDITSRYMFLVTSSKKNGGNIFQSNISVVDRQTRQVLYQASEYVFSGVVAAYHGAFLADRGHRGYLSCGYLDGGIDVWRPNDSNSSRRRYAATDSMILTTIFPSLMRH